MRQTTSNTTVAWVATRRDLGSADDCTVLYCIVLCRLRWWVTGALADGRPGGVVWCGVAGFSVSRERNLITFITPSLVRQSVCLSHSERGMFYCLYWLCPATVCIARHLQPCIHSHTLQSSSSSLSWFFSVSVRRQSDSSARWSQLTVSVSSGDYIILTSTYIERYLLSPFYNMYLLGFLLFIFLCHFFVVIWNGDKFILCV